MQGRKAAGRLSKSKNFKSRDPNKKTVSQIKLLSLSLSSNLKDRERTDPLICVTFHDMTSCH